MRNNALAKDYTIKDLIDYRKLNWTGPKDFLYLTRLPLKFESYFVKPDYYCFGMITQGQLAININNELYDLQKNSLLVYRPGQLWKVSRLAEGTTGTFVLFSRKFLDSLNENIFSVKRHSFLSQGLPSLITLAAPDLKKIKSLFAEIFKIFTLLSEQNRELVARNLTSALIYETDNILTNYIDPKQLISSREEEMFARFSDLVLIHFKKSRKAEFYASKLNVTASYLYFVVKKISGETPTEIIHRKVMREAKFQVSYSMASLAEIAGDLNFCDPFTFSKFFKKNTGQAPAHYRKSCSDLSVNLGSDM